MWVIYIADRPVTTGSAFKHSKKRVVYLSNSEVEAEQQLKRVRESAPNSYIHDNDRCQLTNLVEKEV